MLLLKLPCGVLREGTELCFYFMHFSAPYRVLREGARALVHLYKTLPDDLPNFSQVARVGS